MAVIKRWLEIKREKDEYRGWTLQGLQKSAIFRDKAILDMAIHSIIKEKERGKHYHLRKIEWFIPIQGEATLFWHEKLKEDEGKKEKPQQFKLSDKKFSKLLKEQKILDKKDEIETLEIYEIEPDTCHTLKNKKKDVFVMISLSTEDINLSDNLKCGVNHTLQ